MSLDIGLRVSASRSRVLYICFASPVPSKIGPARRHYHILTQLLRFYDVHVLALGTETEAEMFAEEFGDRVLGFSYVFNHRSFYAKVALKTWLTLTRRCDFLPSRSRELRKQLDRTLASSDFSAVIFSGSLMNRIQLPPGVAVVADSHNVECEVMARTSMLADSISRRFYSRLQAPSTFKEESRCALKANLQLATSDCDRDSFRRKLGVSQVEVIPNGVDVDEFSPSGDEGEFGEILFTGLMSYYPNQQGIRWFLDDVFPGILRRFPAAHLTIAGARPPRWLIARSSQEITVTGAVPDMRMYFRRASVVVVPLMIGGGTRVKILEAQAMARPVVSTSLGAEGLRIDESSIMLADDAESFIANVVALLSDPERASRTGRNGRRLVETWYAWDRIGERLAMVLHDRIGLVSAKAVLPASARIPA